MKSITAIAATALLCALGSPVWAVNKCTGADGAMTFQDTPCSNAQKGEALTIKPASGHAQAAPPVAAVPTKAAPDAVAPAPAAPKPLTTTQKLDAQLAASQKGRRIQELEVRFVPDAYAAMAGDSVRCDQQIDELRQKKLLAKNNLAGATWEQSLSAEMTAISTRCDTRNKELKASYDALKKECVELGGCK